MGNKRTINEIYLEVLRDVWENGIEVSPRGMKCKELIGQKIVIDDITDNIITLPKLKTNIKYAEEEYNWYLSGTNKINWSPLIKKVWMKYSPDGKTANSAYGYRIFGNDKPKINQWEWCKNLLKKDPDTRQAVININNVYDKNVITDVPCTLSLQFLLRKNKLHMVCSMRSNCSFYGFRNDLYCFTKLQQKMADELGVEYGQYIHIAGSFHLYEKDYEKIKKTLKDYKYKYMFIYETINKVNGKTYIGKHCTDNLNDGYMGSGILIKQAITKYGKNNFYKKIICFCTSQKDLNKKEKHYINKNKKQNYNISKGGDGAILPGKLNGMFGKKLTKYARELCGSAFRNKKRPEHAKKISGKNNGRYYELKKEDEEKILKELKKELPLKTIQNTLGITVRKIQQTMEKYNIDRKAYTKKLQHNNNAGDNNPMCKKNKRSS